MDTQDIITRLRDISLDADCATGSFKNDSLVEAFEDIVLSIELLINDIKN